MNLYDSLVEAAQELPVPERGQLFTAVIEFLYYHREPEFAMKPAPKAIYIAMRPVLENQIAKQEAGRKGGKTRSKTEADGQAEAKQSGSEAPSKTEAEAKQTAKQNESKAQTETKQPTKQNATEQEQEQEEEKDSLRESKEKRKRFRPPTPEEVDAYLRERGLDAYLTGDEFCGYYGSQGWRKANGQQVTSWKLAASGWASRERKRDGKEEKHDYGDWDY